MKKIDELRTPAFLVDVEKLMRNISMMRLLAREKLVKLRPHVKTHKTVEIARLQLDSSHGGITVSTLAEARWFRERGFLDITYAFPVTPDKLHKAAEIASRMESLNLLVDHPEILKAMEAFPREEGWPFSVFLKVDPGYHRAGVDPEDRESLKLARALADSEAVDFKGILTHGGHSYLCRDTGEVKKIAETEREVMDSFAAQLRESGIHCPVVSAGSTPTAVLGDRWDGVDELRPGNYVFFDKFQADLGTCHLNDCAASVLTTVAGHYPAHNRILIDAGALALSKDIGAEQVVGETVYGAVMGHPELKVVSLSQEHGMVEGRMPLDYNAFPLGSRLRIIPNHSCLSAACFPFYHAVEGEEVIDEWVPVRGW